MYKGPSLPHHQHAPPCQIKETSPLNFLQKLIQLLQAELFLMVELGDLLDSSLMLIKGDMVGVVKLVQGVFLLKLSCMEANELVGLLASLRGLRLD